MNRSRPVNEQRCERAGGVTLSRTAGLLLILLASFDFWGSSALANSGIDIVIEGNPSLQDLDGLEGVIALKSLAIKSNDALTDLDGLRNLEQIAEALDVQTNAKLEDCAALAPVLGWRDGKDKKVGTANISGNPALCSSDTEILDNTLGATSPVIIGHSATSILALNFARSVEREPIFPVTGHRATCISDTSASESNLGVALADLSPVSRTLEVAGSGGGATSSFVAELEVGIDITHTDPADLLVTLKNPDGVPIVLWDQRIPNSENLTGTFPTTLTPAQSLSGLARERMGGIWTLVVEDVGIGPIVREGTLNSWSLRISERSVVDGPVNPPVRIQGVGQRASYSCTLASLSRLGATPVSSAYSVTVPGVPPQPSISATDYEDGTITLYATVSEDGGYPVTEYKAACRSENSTAIVSSSTSPITVSGLTNGLAYVCSVTAANALGTSVASVATAPIIPEERVWGLPIWLIYQATQ